MDVELRFKHPFTSILSGLTGSWKSSFCIKFLKYIDTQCTESQFMGGIILCYSEKTAVHNNQLSELKENIMFPEDVPEN